MIRIFLIDKILQLLIFDYTLCLVTRDRNGSLSVGAKTVFPFNWASVHKLGETLFS